LSKGWQLKRVAVPSVISLEEMLDKINSGNSPGYRENVQIHIEEHHDE